MLLLLLLLLSRFSRVWLCATPETAAHQAPPSLGFSRQEHWSGLPFPSPMDESEKWKWSRVVMSDSVGPHRQPTRLLHPWDFQARVLEWGAIAFSCVKHTPELFQPIVSEIFCNKVVENWQQYKWFLPRNAIVSVGIQSIISLWILTSILSFASIYKFLSGIDAYKRLLLRFSFELVVPSICSLIN